MANRYERILLHVFEQHNPDGNVHDFVFAREEIVEAAARLDIALPKNVGDVIYSFRYRAPLPDAIRAVAPSGYEWLIEPAGKGKYRFVARPVATLAPRMNLLAVKVPDATPEIIARYAMTDEQALLARLRYNRLIDIFLGMATYSLQNHLRTTVAGVGQIEIDELYVGVNRTGAQFIIPVQAKGSSDRIGSVQAKQDILFCQEKYPSLGCRPIAAQTLADDTVVLFELTMENDQIRVVEEKHYRLTPGDEISAADLASYAARSASADRR